MDVIKDLVRLRDGSVEPQNFTVYLAKTTAEDKKVSSRSIESANVSRRSQILSERSVSNSTSAARDNIRSTNPPRKSTQRITEDLSRQLNVARNATTHPSQLPLTLETPNGSMSSLPRKMVHLRETDPKRIAEKINSQSSNARLTAAEREALISRILTNELEIQSKLAKQAKELFSSPKTKTQSTPSKLGNDHDQLMASLTKKRLQIEAKRAAQERIIFSPTNRTSFEPEIPETVAPPTPDVSLAEKNGIYDDLSRSRPKVPVSIQTRQTRQKFGRSLSPILETSEPRDQDSATGIDGDARNAKGNKRHDMERILAKEKIRQQRMEPLPGELIEDIEASLLLECSDESDSLENLVIKDFAIRLVESEADPATSSLPITEQVIQESNKLKEMIESVKERFQIKVARDELAERGRQKRTPPQNTRTKVPPHGRFEQNKKNPNSENERPAASRTKPINILDSHNWGNIALPKPIFNESVEQSDSSIDEAVLSEKDMQFDDIFGVDNTSEPVRHRFVSQHDPPLSNKKIGRETDQRPDSIKNIEDLESPEFSDLPSDVSFRSISENSNISESIRDIEDLQVRSDKIAGRQKKKSSATKHSTINSSRLKDGIDSDVKTEHERDIEKLKELIDSGALASSIINQRFEEGVLDLLLRQSDSLWDPVVAGIPLIYFIPSRNHEDGLLDTSINASNLETPLLKKPVKKMPEFMTSLENEWTTNIQMLDDDAANTTGADENNNDLSNNDEGVLLHGLPKFSYDPVPNYRYQRNINIMDSKEELNVDDSILDDQEMNYNDLADNVAEPVYDFQKAKIMDDLEIKMKIIRRMTEKRDVGTNKLSLPQEFPMSNDVQPNNSAEHYTQNRSEPVENPVKIRKSVSFANILPGKSASTNVGGNDKVTSQKNSPKSIENGKWTTLDISEVKNLIEHARLAQAKHAGSKRSRSD